MGINEMAEEHRREQAAFDRQQAEKRQAAIAQSLENAARIRRLLQQYLQYAISAGIPHTRREGFFWRERVWVVFNSHETDGLSRGTTQRGAIVYESGRVYPYNTNYEQIKREIAKKLVPGHPWPFPD